MSYDPQAIAKEDAILKAMVTDLSGGLKEIIFPARALTSLIDPGIAYDGSSFQGINEINASDAILVGQPDTIVQVPNRISDSEKKEYWIICNIHDTEGNPHPNCARSNLIRLQKELSSKWDSGQLFMGAEPEAYFINPEDKELIGADFGGNSNYFNPRDPNSLIIAEIKIILDAMGYNIERAHTEVGDSQFEVNWEFDRAERTADKIQIFKLLAHKVARHHGFDVTFLPKPFPSRNGSGMHCHISVANANENLFYAADPSNKNFSLKSLQFLTGILTNARALAAIGNSTEISYSRLVPGFEAPCIVAIGDCNRSAACRIPAIADQKIEKKAKRVEMRFPDPLANPYLLAAGFIASGLAGIEQNLEFIGFTEENLYELTIDDVLEKGFDLLPRNLWEAYKEFRANNTLKDKLGKSIHETYAGLILDEIDACQPFANNESIRRHYMA
jgi:glutamine synthetase